MRKGGPGNVLQVLMNSRSVGTLERQRAGGLYFTYEREWLEREKSMPISRRFPLREKPYSGNEVAFYFENLLPDDAGVRERVAGRVHAASSQIFDLLAALGRDCVGALQFLPKGEIASAESHKPRGREITSRKIAAILSQLRTSPFGIEPTDDWRISIAGAHEKTALLKIKNRWHLPEGDTPTTHILKPPIGPVKNGPDLTLSVENEWLCMELCRAFGLSTAEAEIKTFASQKALVVTRFDRQWGQGRIYRLPQEDLCQALGVSSARKYEAEGGPGIHPIMALLNESQRRNDDRRSFMKAQLVYWLLGAIDGHAKNFSLFVTPAGFRLTPLYDVLSAEPHIGKSKGALSSQKIKFAMAVGKARHYRLADIQVRHWLQTAQIVKFPDMPELLEELRVQTPKVLATVEKSLPKGFPKQVFEPIFEGVFKRAVGLSG